MILMRPEIFARPGVYNKHVPASQAQA